MNVGTRYPEGRTGRPREIGGRHVRKEEEWLREGGPEGLRKAHEARAGHGPEDAGAQGVVQGDREGAGQVALDGERRGGVAQIRDGAEGQARRARGRLRRPVGGLPAPGGVAAMLQRLRAVPRDRLQAPPPRLLRGPGVSVNIFFTIFTNVFSPIAPTRMRRIRLRGCAAFGV